MKYKIKMICFSIILIISIGLLVAPIVFITGYDSAKREFSLSMKLDFYSVNDRLDEFGTAVVIMGSYTEKTVDCSLTFSYRPDELGTVSDYTTEAITINSNERYFRFYFSSKIYGIEKITITNLDTGSYSVVYYKINRIAYSGLEDNYYYTYYEEKRTIKSSNGPEYVVRDYQPIINLLAASGGLLLLTSTTVLCVSAVKNKKNAGTNKEIIA